MAIVFDLNGTLTDPAAIGEPWDDPSLGTHVLDRAVQLALADTVVGSYHDFAEHVEAALRYEVAVRDLDPSHVDLALGRARKLPAYPGTADALDALREGGHQLAVLTNSGAESGKATLQQSGLAGRFELVLGVDAVRKFKPHPDVYAHALRELRAKPGDVTLVAAHAWDVTGAKHAGLRGAWINRHGTAFPATGIAPDHVGRSVAEIAMSLRAADPVAP